MKKSRLLGVICSCLVLSSPHLEAALISADWHILGDNLITRDTVTGLEWLDLTETIGMSRDSVNSQLTIGGTFEGWSYASVVQIENLFDSAGGTAPYNGWQTVNNGVVIPLMALWGSTDPSSTQSFFISSENPSPGIFRKGKISDDPAFSVSATTDYLLASNFDILSSAIEANTGSALFRATVIPLPPALYLFGTGLLGLVGMARRKKV